MRCILTIFIQVTRGNGLTPSSTAFKVNVIDIDAGIDDVYFDIFATICFVFILVVSSKCQGIAVRDTSQTPRRTALEFAGVDHRVLFNVCNLLPRMDGAVD